MNLSEMLFNRDEKLLDYITELQDDNINLVKNQINIHSEYLRKIDNLIKENERLNDITKIMEKYFELIIDLGYDYDGLNEEESLKKLIDELCKYASLGRAYNITEPIYENENKKYNILHEELKESKNER